MKRFLGNVLCVLITFLLLVVLALIYDEADIKENEQEEWLDIGELEIHFIDVGQGDATLIICDGDAMLIDAGDNSQGVNVQNYLMNQGIQSLKYVIGTHMDADHIGGLDVVLYKFDCENILLSDTQKDSASYRDVMSVVKEKGYKITLPKAGMTYEIGSAEFTIIAPEKIYEDENNNSVVILLKHGENRFLFSGDARQEEENDILNSGYQIEADVYKVGHHGSFTSSSEEFLNAIMPEFAVISCGTDNDYGHPHEALLNRLKDMDVEIFRTDRQETIVVSSDGKKLVWNQEPSDDWNCGNVIADIDMNETESNELESAKDEADITYVCNKNSMKFHRVSCESVSEISAKNKVNSDNTREELIEQGYIPCKICNP